MNVLYTLWKSLAKCLNNLRMFNWVVELTLGYNVFHKKLIWIHSDWSTKHRYNTTLHHVHCIYYSFCFRIFIGFLSVWTCGYLISVPFLGNIFLLLVCLVWFRCNFLLYFIYLVLMLTVRILFFSNGRHKGRGSRSKGRWLGPRSKRTRVNGNQAIFWWENKLF